MYDYRRRLLRTEGEVSAGEAAQALTGGVESGFYHSDAQLVG